MKNNGLGRWDQLRSIDRRTGERVLAPFPVLVAGAGASGEQFELQTELDNLGVGGLYVRLPLAVNIGTRLLAVVRLAPAIEHRPSAPGTAAYGMVVRTESLPDGSWGTAVRFERHAFLYADMPDD